MAAAQAEAEATGLPIEEDDMASQLPQEEIESEEPAAEEMMEEPQEGSLPSEEIISEVYSVVFGDAFNPGDENSEEQMEMLKSILSADPKLSQMLSSGEMTISDFAVNLYRMMDDKRAALEAPKK
jgi:hypothetical protein